MSGADGYGVRARTRSDVEAVVGWVASPDDLYLFSGPRLQWPLTADQLTGMARLPGLTAWAVHDAQGDPVGHFDLTLTDDEAKLSRVLIDPARRGQGLALILVGLAEERARALGATSLRLHVIRGNAPAERAYVRTGFEVIPAPADRPDITAMRKPLD